MSWALRLPIGDPVAKLVLVVIADHTGSEHHEAYPSQQLIADIVMVSRQTVNAKVQWLEEQGYLTIEHRSSRGGRTSNLYTLPLAKSEIPTPAKSKNGPAKSSPDLTGTVTTEPHSETSSPRGAANEQDLIFEAVATVCFGSFTGLTKDERGRVNAAVKQLKEVGATFDEIARFEPRYRKAYPGMALSPQALTTHWTELKPKPQPSYPPMASGMLPDPEPEPPPLSVAENQERLAALRARFRQIPKEISTDERVPSSEDDFVQAGHA